MRRRSKQECVSWRKTNFGIDHGFHVREGVTLTPRRKGITFEERNLVGSDQDKYLSLRDNSEKERLFLGLEWQF
jgi:hypothetical protein